ncbi:hypothetical protein TNCV_1456391 [Trichonephila clavipes]|nr:hypothetical protein TNCV_1456391 [Trichonephila clavipes]
MMPPPLNNLNRSPQHGINNKKNPPLANYHMREKNVVVVAYPLYGSNTSQINSIRLLTVKKSMIRCGADVKSSLESPTQFRMCSGEAG